MVVEGFKIKVALLGHVSVGKTTVLNALFRDKFGEVSKKRTTAGINYFRVSSQTKAAKKRTSEDHDVKMKLASESTGSDLNCVTPKETLAQISANNRELCEKNVIKKTFFDIMLDETLVEMRNDTRLVLVDIPGVNEAHSKKLYLDYVERSWDSFDCAVVVMDAHAGVNTQEQVELLKFVKNNISKQKSIPIIVICNKVDDPDDEEVMALVDEVCGEVEQIFEVSDRKLALSNVLIGKTSNTEQDSASPAFIPVSAENAFLYRTASRMQLEDVDQLDSAFLEKIGHEEVSKYKWKKLTKEAKCKIVYKVVSNPAQYQERLELSNFNNFLTVLNAFIGGKKIQEDIIEKQLKVALKKTTVSSDIAHHLCAIFERSVAVEKSMALNVHLKTKFWGLYATCHREAFLKFLTNPANVSMMHLPMKELVEYANGLHKKLCSSTSSKGTEENEKIVSAMKNLVKQLCNVIVEKESTWNLSFPSRKTEGLDESLNLLPYIDSNSLSRDTYLYNQKRTSSRDMKSRRGKEMMIVQSFLHAVLKREPLSDWYCMSPRDWSTIISSILLMTHRKSFCEYFGQEIADLEWLARTGKFLNLQCSLGQSYKKSMEGTCSHIGYFTPRNPEEYDEAVQIKVPGSPAHPDHWGHLAWMFCNFVDSFMTN